MGSFKRNGQSQGPNRRRKQSNNKRQGFLVNLENLETRQLLSGGSSPGSLTPLWTPTSTNLFDAQNGPMANLGVGLVDVYKAYVDGGGNTSALASEFPDIEFRNGEVELQLKSLGGDFSQYVTQLTDVGMNVTTTSSYYGLVDGAAPINDLPAIAEMSQTQSGQVNYYPIAYANNYQGEADNEALDSLQSNVAQANYSVTGAGVTVGVLSTSVNQYNGGLSESYGTGDLNPNSPVNVLQDPPANAGGEVDSDEGRAMLENIHDIAPGANLAFATGEVGGDLGFGQNIEALQSKAGANIEVDDLGSNDEPMFQDGLIAQAIDTVTSDGVSYFSAAGNDGPDSGYLSTFRGTTTSITGIGSGTFMNFNPNGTTTELPITTYTNNASLIFEYDQPFQTQEPAGATGKVTSDVDIYIINASTGAVVVGAAQNNDNVAIQEPWQFITIPTAGTYDIAIQVVSGTNPGHVEVVGFNDTNTALSISQEFGSAGSTSYPTTYGHSAAADTIGVGALPWWSPSPYLDQNPLASEPYSSSGPALFDLSPTGTPTTPTTVDNPTITAPDGGNTSFFGSVINTSDSPPYVPGQPSTPTNLSQDLPSFFGTSSAAPNAAAVAALMKQLVPSLTPAEIRAGLIASAATQPMNGATPGTWNPQGGYGLINAPAALNAVDLLRVSSTSPANGATITTSPSYIQVTFNKPVKFSSLSAADLTFTSAPAGVTVNVGAPIAVDNATDPTIVDFPISFTKATGVLANGKYSFTVQSPAGGPVVVSEDDKDLIASGTISFSLADTTAPTITNTTVSGRTVTITFSKALDPATVTLGNIYVLRKGNATTWPPTPATLSQYIDLNNDPRTTISYDSLTDTVTLDYSNLPQSELPSDDYAIVVTTAVTDLVGNALDGYYTNSFPTTALNGGPYDFIQNLGYEALQAPQITTFTMTSASETGVQGEQNSNLSEPSFIGQVYAPFPGTVAGDQVYVQFQGLQAPPDYVTNLAVGSSGRGYTGTYDVEVTTNVNGTFSLTAPSPLPEGFQTAVAVVVGQPDSPPLPGYSSSYTDAFRIDKTAPEITAASFSQGGNALPLPNQTPTNTTNIASLSTVYLTVVDPVNPQGAPLGTPSEFSYPAINPATASNISNYSLVDVSSDTDQSQYITSAAIVPGTESAVVNSAGYVTAYTAVIQVNFTPGMPFGAYEFIAHTHELQYPGLSDAAGNYLDDTSVPYEGTKDFIVNFAIQNTPVYVTSMALENNYSANGSTAIGSAQSYFELTPTSGSNTRDNVSAPPNTVVIDLSNPVPYANYNPDVLLIGSGNGANTAADGDFGTLGEAALGASGSGFTVVPNTTVTLYNYNLATGKSTQVAPGGSGNRLVLTIAPGTTLSADDYRIYMPNQVDSAGNDTRIFDIYGNQLDGEFLGNQTSQASPDFPDTPAGVTIPEYEDEQNNGTYRVDDMSGDGVPGGAFMTGFTVVPYGNIVYARPDYVENPLVPSTLSTGSLANPYPVLAPEGDPATAPANPSHNPNGGLNATSFFNQASFNTEYDFSGDGAFEQSAFYAASQLAYNGPVVIVALPGLPSRNPVTGAVTEASFVLDSPAGTGPASGGSASVPADTTLVFTAGTTLKLQNASLFVQNQGSALQSLGTTAAPVTFTSYNNASVGGATNNNPDTSPHAGDWGGIVFRNYDEAITSQLQQFPVDGTLVGPTGAAAISGEQDAMSIINNTNIGYGGGAVPQGSSTFYSPITLYNARPMITNDQIANSGGVGGTEGAIGADLDSFREDDTARGPLVRNDVVSGNSLNGIYLMSEANGFIEPTNAMSYPNNPSTLGGVLNYTFDEPLPLIVLAQLVVGQTLLEDTGGETEWVGNRLYIQPGSMVKFGGGSGLDVLNPAASLNVGSRSYINGFDADNNYSPLSTGFVEEGTTDPNVLFTTIYDDTATTPFVPAINVTGEKTTPTLTSAMWGSVGIQSGAVAVINDATFEYGGGAVNTQRFTTPSQSVLAFLTEFTEFTLPDTALTSLGSHVYITNNNFYHNFDAAMQIEPNGLMAGNALTPLASGDPFFRGNVMSGNGIDGLAVVTDRSYLLNPANNYDYTGPLEADFTANDPPNLTVNSVWDATDLTYVLRGTVVLGGADSFEINSVNGITGTGAPTIDTTAYTAEPTPNVTLTIQSALPGTLLANGETIPSPGQSVIVKMLNDEAPQDGTPANLSTEYGSDGLGASLNGGAGFIVGVDDGVDPPTSPLVDNGAYSEIRILGIPGDQTTGQQRVPVIMTSLRDDTVGTTVRGVQMYNILESDPIYQQIINGNTATNSLTAPAAGDGGYIYIGGNSMTEYDPTDPFDGSVIDNADISYMTNIQVQGGGIIYTGATAGDWYTTLAGEAGPATQLNAPMSLTIADSNLANFSEAAVFVHPTNADALVAPVAATGGTIVAPFPSTSRGSLDAEPVFLYMYNDTISNSNEGVQINSEQGDDTTGDSIYQAVILNCTFFNDPIAIQGLTVAFDGKNKFAGYELLAMNDVFDGSSNTAVDLLGQNDESQLQYNLFYNNAVNVNSTTNDADFAGNIGAVYANPDFVGPTSGDATAVNFELQSDSPAIDAGRSEIGPLAGGNALYPDTNLVLSGGQVIGDRTDPTTLPTDEVPGKSDLTGEFGGFIGLNGFFGEPYDSRQIVTLPGSGYFSFPDEWVPVLAGTSGGYAGPASNAGTYDYTPISGVRDILGYIRVPDPGAPGVGYGSNPFIDIGAFQYVNLHPPQVTAVQATENSTSSTTGSTTVPFYTVGGEAGTNQTPQTLVVTFNGPIDPNTLNGNTVQLEELGVAPGTKSQFISLSGKISYNSATDQLIISLGASGLSLVTDEYRLILYGSGSPVIANTQGVALDGEDLSNGDNPSSGTQLALPSGNGYPGGNFYDTFIVNTTPPSVAPGTLALSSSSDSNIVGDNITNVTQPIFTGAITEPNPVLVPLAGQTAIIDVGLDINGTTYFSASQLPSNLSSYAQYLDPDAGTGTTNASGDFSVTVGVDAASTGLVTNTTGLLNLFPIYNVGSSGDLSPVPGTNQVYYVARARVIDQSGNQSNANDTNAQVPFIVDTTPPTASFVSPTSGQVFTSLVGGGVQFTITTDKNIDLTHFTAASISVTSAGPDGILGDGDDVSIPISPSSIAVQYLDSGIGGKGAEQISFATEGTLTNNQYEVTLLNSGADPVEDIAGNVLASPVSETFAVAVPSLSTSLFVGGPAYVTDSTATEGTRENPYPTIGAAMTAAVAGDVVAVLPGVYTENVTLKQFVRLFSASRSSTDSTVFATSTGNALDTVIRAPAAGEGTTDNTITAVGLQSFAGLETEVAGFAIASPLVGDAALGPINPTSSAVYIQDSNVLIDKDYIADAGTGINIVTTGANALMPQIENDVIDGNLIGVMISDAGTNSVASEARLINNDFVFNTIGLDINALGSTPLEAYVASNIFFENHDQTSARNGYAILATYPNKQTLQNNLFFGNGVSDTTQIYATNGLGNGFSPANLSATPDSEGNFVGDPDFVYPVDARPGSAGPADLFVDGDFQITANSAAIDNAWEATAIPTDLIGNSQVKIPGAGYGLPGFGPRDVGAFEYDGTGGNTVGGEFRVVTSSLAPVAGAEYAGGGTLVTQTSPTTIRLTFSGDVQKGSVSATDLILSGSADNPLSPVQATSLTWIDADTVQFNLSGPLVAGTLDVALKAGMIDSTTGQSNLGYTDNVVIKIGTPTSPSPTPTPTPVTTTPTPTPIGISPTSTPTPTSLTPAPAPAPVSVKKKHKVVHKAAHPKPIKHAVATKKEAKHAATHKKEVKEAATHPKKEVKVVKVEKKK